MNADAADNFKAPPIGGRDVARVVVFILLLGFATAVLAALVARWLGALEWNGLQGLAIPFVFAMEAAVILAALYAAWIRFGRTWADLGWVPVSARWIAAGAVASLGVYLVSVAVLFVLQQLGGSPSVRWWSGAVALFPRSVHEYVLMLATGAVAVPIAEELLFRGVLYGWFRARWGIATGTLLSALVFALGHLPSGGTLQIFGVGLVLAWLYERSGSLWPSIMLHGCNNGIGLTLLYAAALLELA